MQQFAQEHLKNTLNIINWLCFNRVDGFSKEKSIWRINQSIKSNNMSLTARA
jgi:hypothetical protein